MTPEKRVEPPLPVSPAAPPAHLDSATARLAELLQTVPPRLANIPDDYASEAPAPGRWSKKQILGHLIDSAGNNHQRWVRAQVASRLEFPGYPQESWVAVQAYATESWPDLVNLWLLLNRHLLHIVRNVPESCLSRPCVIGTHDEIPLSAVIEGYLAHLEHHLAQILETS